MRNKNFELNGGKSYKLLSSLKSMIHGFGIKDLAICTSWTRDINLVSLRSMASQTEHTPKVTLLASYS